MRRWSSRLVALAARARHVTDALAVALLTRRPAQGLVEYGLILVLIMVVCVGILTAVGHTVSNVWYTKIIRAWP